MNTYKRPLLLVLLSFLFISTAFLAKAQCPLTKANDTIRLDLIDKTRIAYVNPSNFLTLTTAATTTTYFNLSIFGVGYSQNTPVSSAANTDNFVMPVSISIQACSVLSYTITRFDPSAAAPNNMCSVTGYVVFRDITPPVLSAADRTVYSLGMSNTVFANSINYKLTDNCPIVNNIKVKLKSEPDSKYRDTILLQCNMRDSLDVTLKAMDACANTSCINIKLIFQDKIGPIYIPASIADTTIFCPAIKDASYFGRPKYMEPCGYTFTSVKIVQDSITSCGTGSFKIEYITKDKYGNLSTPILRKVNVQNPFPFDSATIKWPKDTTYTDNQYTDPSQLPTTLTGKPTWTNKGCDLIAMNMTEMILRVSPTACSFKIMRKWTVANCCKKTGMGTLDTPYVKTQMIVVQDNLAPKLDNLPVDLTVGCDTNCIKNTLTLQRPIANDCNNQATFPNSAFSVSLQALPLGTVLPIGITQDANNPFLFKNVPVGKYKVTYIVKDESNNAAYHTYTLTVRDLTVPKLVAYNRLGTPLGSNGTTMINIMNFISAASDNCTPFGSLKFSFSPTKDSTMLMFDCTANRDCTGDYVKVKIYVKDLNGNTQSVDVEVDVQKGQSSCSCLKPVAGAIQTESGAKVEDVKVSLTQNSNTSSTMTTKVGYYELKAQNNANYTIAPEKDDDVMNGVTTFDLVLINKHILGIQKFTSPYQCIAADIDRSGKISTADVVQLRKLILGLTSKFPNNTSWRFIDKSFIFQDPQNPVLSNIPGIKNGFFSNKNNDFIAIKTGDVNGTAKANSAQMSSGATSRGILPMMMFEAKEVVFMNNQEFDVPVKVKDFGDIIAYQFTMKFNNDKLELLSATPSNNGADCAFGLTHLADGMATTSWMNANLLPMAKGEMVFTLRFRAKSKGKLSQSLSLSSALTKAEAYNEDGETAGVMMMFKEQTTYKTDVKINAVDDISNAPNPFRESTTVRFYLKESAKATLTIFDQTGRLLRKIEGDYTKGTNMIEISDLPAGLMMYRIETPQGISDTRRMLRIE